MKKIINKTKLSSVFELKKIDDIKDEIDVLLKENVDWARLDQNYVDIMITLAGILSENSQNKGTIEAAKKLLNYILFNSPENFDINYNIYKICTRLIELGESEQDLHMQKEIRKEAIKNYCFRWLLYDPSHFVSFYWLVSHFKNEEWQEFFIKETFYEKKEDDYHNRLGQIYYYQYKHRLSYQLNDAIDEYKNAIKYKSEMAIYHLILVLSINTLPKIIIGNTGIRRHQNSKKPIA